nr:cytochrome P450 monooxygenase [Colletotrichum truncatum]KAF6790868.1 cytochrome P450 monooxygenase [Colletotrichum truncatum]
MLNYEFSWGPSTFAAVVAASAALIYVLRWLALPKPFPGIPYNEESANRVLGDMPLIRAARSRRTWFAETALSFNSPLSQIFFPFTSPLLICADPVEANDICTRRLKEFKRNSALQSIFGCVIPNHHIGMADDDPRFKKNRELVRDLMTPAFLHEVSAPQIYDKGARLVELWTEKMRISNGRPFEAGRDIHNMALDIILSVAFNRDESLGVTMRNTAHLANLPVQSAAKDETEPATIENLPLDTEAQVFNAMTDSVGMIFKSPLPRLRGWFLKRTDWMKKAMASKDEMTTRELAKAVERMEASEPPRCAMDQILLRERAMAEKEGRQPDYYSPTIRDELLGYLVAGHDTTSSAFQWGLKFIARNQPAQKRLRATLREAFPSAAASGRAPTATEILKTQIPYLDAVVEEILRCCETLPITSREAKVDTQVLGHHVPKGTVVLFIGNGPGYLRPAIPVDESKRTTETAKHAAHRAHVWDPADVDAFKPERWMKKTTEDGEEKEVFDATSGPFMPFGYGPRACFGKRLAYMEMRIVLCHVIWAFELETVSKELDSSTRIEALATTPGDCYVKLRNV